MSLRVEWGVLHSPRRLAGVLWLLTVLMVVNVNSFMIKVSRNFDTIVREVTPWIERTEHCVWCLPCPEYIPLGHSLLDQQGSVSVVPLVCRPALLYIRVTTGTHIFLVDFGPRWLIHTNGMQTCWGGFPVHTCRARVLSGAWTRRSGDLLPPTFCEFTVFSDPQYTTQEGCKRMGPNIWLLVRSRLSPL